MLEAICFVLVLWVGSAIVGFALHYAEGSGYIDIHGNSTSNDE
jgi:hypothetical protein